MLDVSHNASMFAMCKSATHFVHPPSHHTLHMCFNCREIFELLVLLQKLSDDFQEAARALSQLKQGEGKLSRGKKSEVEKLTQVMIKAVERAEAELEIEPVLAEVKRFHALT